MRRSWRKIIAVLARGGLLWAGGHPRKRAWLVPRAPDLRELDGRVVKLSTIVDMEAEDLIQTKEERSSDGLRSPDDYWELTEKARKLA